MSLFGNNSDPANGTPHFPQANGNANGNGHPHSNGNGNGHGNGNGNGNGHAKNFVPRTILSSGVSIKGSVKFRSELVIDGEVEGTIDSIGRLTVGRNGHVRGEIRTRSVTIHGTVDGNLSANERCELRAGCILRGDIESSRLVVEDDVTFIGSAAIATRDYLSELRAPNGNGNGNGNGHSNGNGH